MRRRWPVDKLLPALVILGMVVLVFVGLGFGWRARRRRQAGLPALASPPETLGETTFSDDVFYVSTTRADAPTDRIAVRGLGFRARASVSIVPEGLVLRIAGQPDAFIPKSTVVGVGRATWTIDRVVGRDGLVFVRWTLGDTEVDTNFRSSDPDSLVSALSTIAPIQTAPTERGAA
jgi:hypothetical protein